MPRYTPMELEELLRRSRSGYRSGGGSGYGSVPVVPSSDSVLLNMPAMAFLGPSTVDRGWQGGAYRMRITSGTCWSVLWQLMDFATLRVWQNVSNTRSGDVFAFDGWELSNMAAQVSSILALDATVVCVEPTRNGLTGLSVNGYVEYLFDNIVDPLLAGGKTVFLKSMWERDGSKNTADGWGPGGENRPKPPLINDAIESGCASRQNCYYLETRSVMIDFGDPDLNPYANRTCSDGIHPSNIGAVIEGRRLLSQMSPYFVAQATRNPLAAGNLHPNPTMTGSTSANGNAGMSGVLPPNWKVERRATYGINVTAVSAVVTDGNGINWLEATIDSSAVAAGDTGEEINIGWSANISGLTVNAWYQVNFLAKFSSWDAWLGWRARFTDTTASPRASDMLVPLGDDGAYNDDPATDGDSMPELGEEIIIPMKSHPVQLATGTTAFTLIPRFKLSATTGVAAIANFELRQVSAP